MDDESTPKNESQDQTLSLPAGGLASAPAFIGNYRIISRIGAGGMGVVFEAEQQQPRRAVALKVIRGGSYVDDHTVRMFRREADVLARLRHSGIAAIYESGRTEDGQHFFTMELIRGVPLNQYLKQRPEPGATTAELRQRLILFGKICAAVSYAHQRGVLHRDLKPSNIMIVSGSDGPDIKILDFGLARITDADVTITTFVTGLHGTLSYMSPEQASGHADDLDVRSDVYSLGVILYELLAGKLPYDIHGKLLPDAVAIISEQPPGPLSKRPGGLKVDTDLETVVFKALEKDRERRYQGAAALAEDVERYLSNQPVLARPASALYQIRKLISRHKLGFAFATALVVLLAATAAVMTVQAERIAAERNRANNEAEAARQVSDFLVGLFQAPAPAEARGKEITARELLDRGAEKIDRELKGQPLTQARLKYTIAAVLIDFGMYQKAATILESARQVQQARLGDGDPAVSETLDRLATAYQGQGEYAKAEPLFRRVLSNMEKIRGPQHPETASALNNLAVVCSLQGKFGEAEPLLKRALAIYEKSLGPNDPKVGQQFNNLAYVAGTLGRDEEAMEDLKKALWIREKALGPDHPDVAETLDNFGVILWRKGKNDEAAKALERSLAIYQKVLGPEHDIVGQLMANLANVYADQGRLDQAESLYLRSLEVREKALGPAHPDVAHSSMRLASLRQKQGNYTQAIQLFNRAIIIYDHALGPDSVESCTTRNNLANLYRDRREFAKAEPLYQRSLAGLEKSLGPQNTNIAHVLDAYTEMLKKAGRGDEADPLEQRAKEIRRSAK